MASNRFKFCGADGLPHDSNIIRCPKCLGINPILSSHASPDTQGDVIVLSDSPPTTAPPTAVFATADPPSILYGKL
jgi:hypothetical protein